jgi:2-methylcitrate dehydratase
MGAHEKSLGRRIAELASASRQSDPTISTMIAARVLDSIGVMLAAKDRPAVLRARNAALAHPRADGAAIVGVRGVTRAACEWAAMANGVALRELDLGDMFAGADYARPSDCIPALLSVAQQCGRCGADLLRGIAISYEVQIALARSIALHPYNVDPVAHLAPAVAAGTGTLLGAPQNVIVHAVHAAAQRAFMTRLGRADGDSDWRSHVPAAIVRLSIESMDYALRGGTAPDAVYEDAKGPVATFLGGTDCLAGVSFPGPDEPCRAVADSFAKAHAAQYQCQALIDLALRLRPRIASPENISRLEILTSHHLHRVVGTSWRDDPQTGAAPRPAPMLDIARLAIHLLRHGRLPGAGESDGPDGLEDRVHTVPTEEWSARSHHRNPDIQCFGATMRAILADGERVEARMEWPDAHRLGERPWRPVDHERRFRTVTADRLTTAMQDRMIETILALERLGPDAIAAIDLGGTGPEQPPVVAGGIFQGCSRG